MKIYLVRSLTTAKTYKTQKPAPIKHKTFIDIDVFQSIHEDNKPKKNVVEGKAVKNYQWSSILGYGIIYLGNMIDNLKVSSEWKINLSMKINF